MENKNKEFKNLNGSKEYQASSQHARNGHNPTTQKQKEIIKAIAMAYRISVPGEVFRSSKKASEFISKYKEHIKLYYGDIYIDGKLILKFKH